MCTLALRGTALLLLAIVAGCGDSTPKRKVVRVETVPYTIPATTEERCDSTMAGGITGGTIGYLLSGEIGAIIGVVVGSSGGKCKTVPVPSRQEKALIVYMDDGKCFINWTDTGWWKVGKEVHSAYRGQDKCKLPSN